MTEYAIIFAAFGAAGVLWYMVRSGGEGFRGRYPLQAMLAAFVLFGLLGLVSLAVAKALGYRPQFALSPSRTGDDNAAITGVAVVGTLIMAWGLLGDLMRQWRAAQLYRRLPLGAILDSYLRSLAGQGLMGCWSPALIGLALYVSERLGLLSLPSIFYVPIWLAQLSFIARDGTPPSVLLLTSSRWEGVRLFNLIERAIYPYRVAVLLDPNSVERQRHSQFHWWGFEEGNWRVRNAKDWRIAVTRLAGRTPTVVLDTRLASPCVVEEAKRMSASPFRDKTVFVTENNGDAPAIEAAGVGREGLRVSALSGVVGKLKAAGLSHTMSPDNNPVLAASMFARNARKLALGMGLIARALAPMHHALVSATKAHGRTEFIEDAWRVKQQFDGKPNSGAREVYAELQGDIRMAETFVMKWDRAREARYQEVLLHTRLVLRELYALQRAVDQTPPSFWPMNDEYLRTKRLPGM